MNTVLYVRKSKGKDVTLELINGFSNNASTLGGFTFLPGKYY